MTKNIGQIERGGFLYFAALILFLALSVIGHVILSLIAPSDTARFAVSSLYSVAAFAFFTVIYNKNGGKIRFFRKFKPTYCIAALMLAAGMLLGLGFLNLLVADGIKSAGGYLSEPKIPLDTPFQFVLFTVLLCVFPAVAEELFFRGVLAECLSGVKKGVGVITVALCFAVYHGSAAQLCYQFVYGLGLGFLALKAQSVLPAVIAHFINNFAVLSVEYFNISLNLNSPAIIAVGSALCVNFVLLLVFFDKKPPVDSAAEHAEESVKKFYLPFGALGIFVATLIIVLSLFSAGA